jgi:hypothetical protein
LLTSFISGVYGHVAYRDKKVVGVFVRFRATSDRALTGSIGS